MPDQNATTLLAVLVGQDERTHADIVQRFEQCARTNGENATLSLRTLRRWMSGQIRTAPHPSQRRVARLFWGRPMIELLAPPPAQRPVAPPRGELIATPGTGATARPGPAQPPVTSRGDAASPMIDTLERQVAMATRRAARFMTFAEIDNVGPEAIAQLQDDVIHLANAYNRDPLAEILRELPNLQETAFRLLEGRQKPAFTRDLYLLASIISGMIAKASHDLGQPHDAMAHARTMYVCADNAGHQGLCAWARGLQSLISYWAGRPQEAIRHAQHGATIAAGRSGSVSSWLPALEARSWALVSAHHEAAEALGRADDQRAAGEPDDLDTIGGLFAFPPAKQRYYAAGTYVHLSGEHGYAQAEALSALDQFEHGRTADRSYSDEAGARAELALARVHTSDVDGAQEALTRVLELPPERRIDGILISTTRVHQALSRRQLTDSPTTRNLQEAIESFCRLPAAALPG
ncbi:MAG: hypothetical protein HKP61_16670 [Dactylosporangium sp.]|nr:hypothetical protein [Dactylosporangium sp.]NNJ62541.1 hypothetical protein [Dactylosporangium sp.]